MSVFANFRAHIHSEIIHGFGPLNHLLANALRPLKPDLLANLEETQSSLSVSWVVQRAQKTFEELEHINEVAVTVH